ncbi:uncharacterized protein LOC112588267 isoform X2 [Harpegnathos saltator]|uniref:uncharacterized protein LOC112588267 isoform X2 n=1 Tax=Harpegnathos saltator TaxID=610380 RepID=UPI000DBEEE10|nr:uncharacterized protein LOC112588267 isoform X2 [Harpegnathos saltator]
MMDVSDTIKGIPKDSNDGEKNITDDKYSKKIHDLHDNIEFPSDFDAWTVQEQRDWVYNNMTELYSYVPESLQCIISGIFRPVDFHRSQEKLPEWMDMDKYRRGQKFVRDHYCSFVFSILLGTVYGLTFNDGLKPLIISRKSITPYLAFKRYLDTAMQIFSWYEGEPWVKGTKAYKAMQIARIKHMNITTKISRMNKEQVNAATKIAYTLYPEDELFLKDMDSIYPSENPERHRNKVLKTSELTIKALNNTTVTVAQGSFILLSIIYPQNIGLHNATDEDLEAFCHMWKCYGYFLGAEDEYNFCRGSLEEIKQRLWDLRNWITINFTDVTPEWMYMIRCMIESINYYPSLYMPYKAITLFYIEALNLKMPNFYASFNYSEWIMYKIFTFFARHLLKFSIVRTVVNQFIRKVFDRAINLKPEELAKLQEKSKSYLDFVTQS